MFCHPDACTHRHLTHRLIYTHTHTHKHFYTKTLLHTDPCTAFCHTDAFTHRRLYTQTLLHTDPFTHRCLQTQSLLHTDPLRTDTFTHRGFDTQRLDTQTRLHIHAFTHREFRRTRQNCNFYISFWWSNLISFKRVATDSWKSEFLPQFWTIEPRFVRKSCISWRLVGTGPRLKREIEKKESKRAREQ